MSPALAIARRGALLLSAALPAPCGARAAAPTSAPPALVLVVLDSVRADHLGAYGYQRATPRFDALAAEGVLFERAYAGSSAALQSFATTWTGRLPASGGHVGLREAAPHPEVETLPRLARRAGYRSALVSNHPGLGARTFTRGYDDVEVDLEAGRWSGEVALAKALELLATPGPAPLFLTLVLADASEPFLPPAAMRARIPVPEAEEPLTLAALRAQLGALPPDVRTTPGFLDLVARYDAEIAQVDALLGALVDALRARGTLDETWLVVAGNHGTELLEHGSVGHGWTLHDEVLRVPLLVRAPRALAPARIDAPVSLADLLPTLQALMRPEAAPAAHLDGQALFERRPDGWRPRARVDPVLAELVVPELCVMRAAIDARWKRVEVLAGPAPGERLSLLAGHEGVLAAVQRGERPPAPLWGPPVRVEQFDLELDPGEQHRIEPGAVGPPAGLAARLALHAKQCAEHGLAAPVLRRAPEENAVDVSPLQQIGYL